MIEIIFLSDKLLEKNFFKFLRKIKISGHVFDETKTNPNDFQVKNLACALVSTIVFSLMNFINNFEKRKVSIKIEKRKDFKNKIEFIFLRSKDNVSCLGKRLRDITRLIWYQLLFISKSQHYLKDINLRKEIYQERNLSGNDKK